MISQTAEYALRAIVILAQQDPEPCTAEVIAAGTKVPRGYLSKIMQSMAKEGLVTSRRGLHGGFALARPPGKISVFDVLSSVDPIRRYESCPLELPWHCKEMCKLHSSLDEMIGRFVKEAKRTPIADLLPPAEPIAVKRRSRSRKA